MPAILLMLLLSGPARAQNLPAAPTPDRHEQIGVTVKSPRQPGWTLTRADKTETRFERREAGESITARVRTLEIEASEQGNDLLANLETRKQNELIQLKRDSIHFDRVGFKGLTCLRYDGIFGTDSTSAATFRHVNIKGYVCPLPGADHLVIEMEVSSRSNRRGFSEAFLSVIDEFFATATFHTPAAR